MEKKEKKHLTKKQQVIAITCCAVGGIVIGGGAGLAIGYFSKAPTVELGKVDLSDVEDNSGLLEKYEKCKSEGKDPTKEFSLAEIANISLQKLATHDKAVIWGYGTANSAVNLNILNCVIKNGDTYLEESLSKSAPGSIMNIVVAQRDIQKGLSDDSPVESYRGDIKSDDASDADFSNASKTDYTVASYRETFGKSVDNPNVYVVSNSTVLTDTVTQTDPTNGSIKVGQSNIEKVDGGYKLYMELNTVKGVARYYYRMVNLSGSNVSMFNYVHLTYNLDDDFNLISSNVKEEYVAGMGNIKATVNGEITTYFFPDEELEIPDLNTKINFPKEGEAHE